MKTQKIAYIQLRPLKLIGVDKKTEAQAKAIEKLGYKNFHVYIVNPHKEADFGVLKYKKCSSDKFLFKMWDYLYCFNFRRYKIFEKLIDLSTYDFLILRYPKADKSGISFMKRYNVITEHHGILDTDLFRVEINHSRNFLYKAAKYIRLQIEAKYQKEIFRNVKGIIGMTNEICEVQNSRLKKNTPKHAISNGVGVEEINLTKFVKFDGMQLDMVLIGSQNVPWHGIERLVSSIKTYKGNVKLKFHLIGNLKIKNPPSFVIFHGELTGRELDSVMSKMNLAISTFALFKENNMNEQNTLKTREYIARGIPFLLAYNDTDLMANPPNIKFFKQFLNNDSLIDFNEVIEFIKDLNEKYSIDEIALFMRKYAKQHLDWTIKMKQYVEFVDLIAKRK